MHTSFADFLPRALQTQYLRHYFLFVKVVLAAVYLLVVLMSFACEYYNVVFSGVLQGILYGFPAVFYDYVFAA